MVRISLLLARMQSARPDLNGGDREFGGLRLGYGWSRPPSLYLGVEDDAWLVGTHVKFAKCERGSIQQPGGTGISMKQNCYRTCLV